ncbi:hypothetical protein AB4Y85_10880 [Microvirga sp. 2YAF29]|uniref:hypothetical protein n=1 Tax=Microvirga sp. 2YAF29 TaxID=3233031 RepID=UPI003F9593D8
MTSSWLDEHIAVRRPRSSPAPRYSLSRTQVWTSGLTKSEKAAFNPDSYDRSLGARLQPFDDLNLRLGTELVRSGGDNGALTSRAKWEAFWSREADLFGGLNFGLSTGGSMATLNTGYSQTVSGTLGIPVGLALEKWSTQVRLSPNMNVDTASGAMGSGLMSEIMGQTVLSSQADPYRSVLNVKAGYGVAQDTRPAASAMLEFRISPNL